VEVFVEVPHLFDLIGGEGLQLRLPIRGPNQHEDYYGREQRYPH
jgi:hypothetical protein